MIDLMSNEGGDARIAAEMGRSLSPSGEHDHIECTLARGGQRGIRDEGDPMAPVDRPGCGAGHDDVDARSSEDVDDGDRFDFLESGGKKD